MGRRLGILLWGAAVAILFAAVGCRREPVANIPDKKPFVITPELEFVEFAFSQSKEINFDITGEGAIDLKFPKITAPDDWECRIIRFGRRGDTEGYIVTAGVTAPAAESSGTVLISVVNAEGTEQTAAINIAAVAEPLEVDISVPDEAVQFELSESRSVTFTVSRNNPVGLTAEVSATNSWGVQLVRFAADDDADPSADYSGSVLVTAPDTQSSSEITITVKSAAGAIVGSAKFVAECIKMREADIELDIPVRSMSFAFSQARTALFTVTGEDARNLTATAIAPDGWSAGIISFEEYSYGYRGTVSITAPASESDGTVTLHVAGSNAIAVSGSIDVASLPSGLKFSEESYRFGINETATINYTVTGTDGRTLKSADIIYPHGWSLDSGTPPSFGWDEVQDIYTGSFLLRSGNYPENNTAYVRLTDINGKTADWPVDIICGGGTPVPTSKQGANCIVVSRAGGVSFDARKGDGTPVAGSSVKRIWTDNTNLIDEGSLAYSAGKISFDTAPAFTSGNMLIALSDSSGEIVWTWHIWFVSGLNLDAAAGEFMNMSLGAVSASRNIYGIEDLGLLYQWGRKEPFPSPNEKTGLDEDSAGAFMANTRPVFMADGYSWGCTSERTDTHDKAAKYPTAMVLGGGNMPSAGNGVWEPVADPCPAGWRVPNHRELQEHWDFYHSAGPMASKKHSGFEYEGMIPNGHPGEWWPAAGLRIGSSHWGGALRLTGMCHYWSCVSTGRYSFPTEGSADGGYILASAIGNIYDFYMESLDREICDAAAVRCIKE